MKRSPIERFMEKVEIQGTCLIWTAGIGGGGSDRYGWFWDGETEGYAHRWAYEYFIGPIPDGMELDHLCSNTRCVEPAHLEPVTHRVNVLRGKSPSAVNARKTHCIRGHEFDPANTIVMPGGRRNCRECTNERDRRRYHDRKTRW